MRCEACGIRFKDEYYLNNHIDNCPKVAELRNKSKQTKSLVKIMTEEEFAELKYRSDIHCGYGVCASYNKKSSFGKWYEDD